MANFDKALALILMDEGTYSKDPDDSGGETCFGIDAASNPAWVGWPLVHSLLAALTPKENWHLNVDLMTKVSAYYKAIWDGLFLDSMANEALAMSLYGSVINQGRYRSVIWFKIALAALDKDFSQDGEMDVAVITGCNELPTDKVLDCFETLRKAAYITTAAHAPHDRKFLQGWFNRLKSGA